MVGVVAYFLYFKGSKVTPIKITQQQSNQNQPALPENRIKAISELAATNPVISPAGDKIRYFDAASGNIIESDFNGSSIKKLTSSSIKNFISARWSPDRQKFIAWFQKDAQLKSFAFNFITGVSYNLPENSNDAAFSPDSKKIVYYNFDTPLAKLKTANIDGRSIRDLFATAIINPKIFWSPSGVSLQSRPSGLAAGLLLNINPINGDLKGILNNTFGLDVLWAPDGKKFIFSSTDESGGFLNLNLGDLAGFKQKLNLQTFAKKCVWSQFSRSVYCGVLNNIPIGTVLPDDYYKGLVDNSDQIWRINVENNETKLLISATDKKYDMQDLILSPQEDYLFFVNGYDGLLYSVKL